MTAVSAFFGAIILFAAALALLHFILWPWQGAAVRFLHRIIFFWHKRHVFFFPDKRPDGESFCAVCNLRLRYVRGITGITRRPASPGREG